MKRLLIGIVLVLFAGIVIAEPIPDSLSNFVSGSTISSSTMNAHFDAVEAAVDDNAADIDALQTEVRPGSLGGTGDAYVEFDTGGTTLRTYTLPDSSGTVVTTLADQILVNKSLNNPTIIATGFTNANHNHESISRGGLLSPDAINIADGDLLDFSSVVMNTALEGIYLPQAADCSSSIAESQVCWDNDDHILYIGNGTGSVTGIGATFVSGNEDTLTWGAGSLTDFTWTYDLSGATDPAIQFGPSSIDFSVPISATSFTADDPGDGARGTTYTSNTSGNPTLTAPSTSGECKIGFVDEVFSKHCNNGNLVNLEIESKSFSVVNGVMTAGEELLHHTNAALTLLSLDCTVTGSTTPTVTYTVVECASTGASCATTGLVASLSAANTLVTDDTPSNASIDANDWWGLEATTLTTEGDVTHCTVEYVRNG